jgi:hypothetical protein
MPKCIVSLARIGGTRGRAALEWIAAAAFPQGVTFMPLRDLFQRLLGDAPAAAGEPFPPQVEALVPEFTDLIAEEVEPRLKLAPDFRRRMTPGVRATIAYMRSFAPGLEAPLALTPARWNDDPRLNAFFATAGDIAETLGRSRELRGHFAAHPADAEACAVLSMERRERSVLGVGLQGDVLRHDVAQTTVSFADHRVAAPAADEEGVRLELGERIFRGLLGIALERIEALQAGAQDLDERRARLETRLRRLKTRGAAVEALAEGAGAHAGEIADLERELEQTRADTLASRARLASLDGYMNEAAAVLERPAEHFTVESVPVRVNRMGVRVEGDASGPVNKFRVAEIVARDFRRALVLARCRRADLPPERAAFADAERYL